MSAHIFPFTDPIAAEGAPPKEIASGEGARVRDASGNLYLDAVAGLWCASLGFNPERLARAAAAQMTRLAYYHSFMGRTCAVTNRLAERLAARLPGDLRHVYFGTSGSEAVETAVKFARYHQAARGKPEKRRVIARAGAYHGSGHVSAALTGMSYCHEGFDVPLDEVLRTGRPHYLRDAEPGESEAAFSRRLARELDDLIRSVGAERIAAFIGEPAMGSGGVFLPPDGYWDAVQEVLAAHDILLIADEIITGFGRTGEWFACETYGIRPDLMTLAKQMTGAVFPMSAVAMTGAVRAPIAAQAHRLGTLGHGVTYGGHPVAAAVALEALAIYEEMDLPRHVRALGARLMTRLAPLRGHSAVADVRGAGLMAAVEMAGDPETAAARAKAVGAEAERRGVLFRIIGPVLALSPPYIVTAKDIDEMAETLAASLQAVAR